MTQSFSFLATSASAIFYIFISVSPATAQPRQEQTSLESWLKSELRKAASLPGTPLVFSWKDSKIFCPSPSELESFEFAVRSNPEHALRDVVPTWRAHANGHPTVLMNEVWWNSKDAFRVNLDYPESHVFMDSVRTSSNLWDMGTHRLSYFHENDAIQLTNSSKAQFQYQIADFIASGLLDCTWEGVSQPRFEYLAEVSRWLVSFDFPPSLRLEYTIRWDESSQRGFVEKKARIILSEAGKYMRVDLPTMFEYKNYERFDSLQLWCPRVIRSYNAKQQPCSEITLQEISSLTPTEFADVTVRPSASVPDVVRGWEDALIPVDESAIQKGGLVSNISRRPGHRLLSFLAYGIAAIGIGVGVWVARRSLRAFKSI